MGCLAPASSVLIHQNDLCFQACSTAVPTSRYLRLAVGRVGSATSSTNWLGIVPWLGTGSRNAPIEIAVSPRRAWTSSGFRFGGRWVIDLSQVVSFQLLIIIADHTQPQNVLHVRSAMSQCPRIFPANRSTSECALPDTHPPRPGSRSS